MFFSLFFACVMLRYFLGNVSIIIGGVLLMVNNYYQYTIGMPEEEAGRSA
jgi:hypothetical protein